MYVYIELFAENISPFLPERNFSRSNPAVVPRMLETHFEIAKPVYLAVKLLFPMSLVRVRVASSLRRSYLRLRAASTASPKIGRETSSKSDELTTLARPFPRPNDAPTRRGVNGAADRGIEGT